MNRILPLRLKLNLITIHGEIIILIHRSLTDNRMVITHGVILQISQVDLEIDKAWRLLYGIQRLTHGMELVSHREVPTFNKLVKLANQIEATVRIHKLSIFHRQLFYKRMKRKNGMKNLIHGVDNLILRQKILIHG